MTQAGPAFSRSGQLFRMLVPALLLAMTGCVVCSADRVFPKLAFRWSRDGERELESRREEKAYYEAFTRTNAPSK